MPQCDEILWFSNGAQKWAEFSYASLFQREGFKSLSQRPSHFDEFLGRLWETSGCCGMGGRVRTDGRSDAVGRLEKLRIVLIRDVDRIRWAAELPGKLATV